jgi:hypothetical protein
MRNHLTKKIQRRAFGSPMAAWRQSAYRIAAKWLYRPTFCSTGLEKIINERRRKRIRASWHGNMKIMKAYEKINGENGVV